MRVENSVKNIKFAIIGQIISILVSFLTRIIFIKILGETYLGLNGLLTNIISILSLAEMGFGTAMVYSLYEPLAKRDQDKINALMKFYSSMYLMIGFIILVLGIIIMPFLKYIIDEQYIIKNINLIYILYLLNTVITYFYAHKRSLIVADQKAYISTIYKYLCFTILNIVQVIILIISKNFILYIIVQIIMTFIENFLLARRVDKEFPELKNRRSNKINNESRQEIFKNVKAMICHRFGGVIVNSTDNIVMSIFVGIKMVGRYSNYQLIITALNSIITQIFTSLSASIGNLNALESRNKSIKVCQNIQFFNFWLIGFSSISLWILLNPFISIWIGDKYIMNTSVVIMIVLNFYVTGMRKTTLVFKESLGLFWHDRYRPLFEGIINLVLSIIFARYIGITGILLGTFISTITTCFWIEPYVLYKYGFKQSMKKYWINYLIYTTVMIIGMISTSYIASTVIYGNVLGFILRILICLIVPNFIFLVCFHKTSEFKYFYNVLIRLLNKNIIKMVKGVK